MNSTDQTSSDQLTTRGALWLLAWAATVDDPDARWTAETTPATSATPDDILRESINAVVAYLRQYADSTNTNPACLGAKTYKTYRRALGLDFYWDNGRGMPCIYVSANHVLAWADPHHESTTDHDHCRPWDTATETPLVETSRDGRLLESRGPYTITLAGPTPEQITQAILDLRPIPTRPTATAEQITRAAAQSAARVLANTVGTLSPDLATFRGRLQQQALEHAGHVSGTGALHRPDKHAKPA
jgi:hypothetical protein